MSNKHCEFWEEIVTSEEQKRDALKAATSNGLQWVSTSRVEGRDGFIPGAYRMRFAERPQRQRAPIKFAGHDYRDRARQ
ncbi:hypothetical protein HFO71_24210 [Rhizobium laguerreae]|uniref:hypothetical protein n=1 Tax=Rhizobium laguerreae TaxID=1076926 RepID=UPI001C917CEC|nr:hypothetical protein [Rhizobium laguerreae]MBY3073421.1 hypothetical protein [Rhizobium laguerreae]